MEIGQTLVVKNKTVIAVEAFEGTDKAIQRGCELIKKGCVVIKVSRTNQDYRYDSPGIGPQTIETLIGGGASVLALEAERVMVVEQEKVIKISEFELNNQEVFLKAIKELQTPINLFFESIIVNVENKEIKDNRLKLMFMLKELIIKYSNFDIIED